MSSTKKGNTWYFGMKAHIGVDPDSAIKTASDHDNRVIGELVREGDRAVFGDKRYYNDPIKQAARKVGMYWVVLDKAKHKRNKKYASVRAKVERVIRTCSFEGIVKC